MRFRKRYLVAVAIVFVMAFLKFRVGFDNFVNVDEFRGADIQSGILYPMIAQSINRNKIIGSFLLLVYPHAESVLCIHR